MLDRVRAGIDYADLGITHPFKLSDHCSNFQAEVVAVGKTAEITFAKTSSNTKINTHVDSQATIKAINS